MRRVRLNLRLVILFCLAFCTTWTSYANSACFAPFNIHSTLSTSHSVEISWSDFTSPSDFIQYELELVLFGQDPDFNTVDTSLVKNYIFENLEAGQSYELYIRTICVSGETNWTSGTLLNTNLVNENSCESRLIISDDNCPSNSNFILEVNGPVGSLGLDLFIQSIHITIDHAWPADLNLSLLSPSGKSVLLVQDKGIGYEDYGIVTDACTSPLSFDMNACESIATTQAPLIGSFRPEGDLSEFYDETSAQGNWVLEICDDAQGQTGILLYAEITFSSSICSGPNDIFFRQIENDELSLIIPSSNCDSLEISYTNISTNQTLKFYVDCIGDTVKIESLEASSEYLLSYSAMCEGNILSSSCPKPFSTRCQHSANYEDFNYFTSCSTTCFEQCNIDGFWTNSIYEAPWIINEGTTSSSLTGPEDDFYGSGKYIYIESSDTFCNNSEAILLSGCFQVNDPSSCNLSFTYHMKGNDISYLHLDISLDHMSTWNTIWQAEGEQGPLWNKEEINLGDYIGQNIQLRFASLIPENNFGDIALDEIVLSGVEIFTDSDILIYADNDLDGFGDSDSGIPFCGEIIPEGFSGNNLDCDDTNSLINPDAQESPCNILDDNCNGEIDEDMGGSTLDYNLILIQDQNCTGVADGQIIIEAFGGIGPYNYTWLDGNFEGNERLNLTSGVYQAIIEDQGGCQLLTDSFYIETLQNFDFFISSVIPATCEGIDNGAINISHDESNAPYTYQWSSGDTTKNISAKATGNYQVIITDVNGCVIETDSVFLMPIRTLEIELDSIHQISCAGDSNGYLQVSTINHVGPVTYTWENNSMDSIRTGLVSGDYAIEVMDSSGCINQKQFLLEEPELLQVKIGVNDPVICYGDQTGLLVADIQGGTEPFSFTWNNGSESRENSHLAAGVYSITVQDSNECIDSMSNIIVVQPDSMELHIDNILPAICVNNTGSIDISAQGGNGDYSYFWSDNIAHGTVAEDLNAGNYTITLTDAFDCKISQEDISVPLIEVPLLTDIIETNDLSCYQNFSGSIQIEITNSTTNSNYFVFNNDSILVDNNIYTKSNLEAGIYQIQMIDENGCISDSLSIELFQPEAIQIITETNQDLACYQDSSGIISISINGGNGPYEIMWETGEDSSYLENLPAGNYMVTTTDSNNCMHSIEISINEPLELSVEDYVVFDELCFGDSTGSIQINHNQGGTAPYSYISEAWMDSDSSYQDGLAAGEYKVLIRDANNCQTDTSYIFVNSPEELILNLDSIYPSICDGENGRIFMNDSGGTGMIEYEWDGFSGNGAFVQNLSSGTYGVSITDQHGCQDSLNNIFLNNINQEIFLTVDLVDSVSCYGGSNGIISTNLSGDIIPPYNFIVNNNPYQASDSPDLFADDLIADIYNIVVIDGNNCSDTLGNLEILEPLPIEFDLSVIDSVQCFNDTNGIIGIIASGGNGDFEYLWNNSEQGDTLFNLGAGIYTCAIKDKKNCLQFTDTIHLLNPDSLYIIANIVDATGDENNGGIYIETFGGTSPYIYQWDPYLPTEVDTIEGLSESNWLLSLIDKNGCTIDTSFTINRIVNTSISENFVIDIWPTITSDVLILSSDLIIDQWIIYNQLGQPIHIDSDEIKDQEIIDVNQLLPGTYFIELRFGNEKLIKTFIKL